MFVYKMYPTFVYISFCIQNLYKQGFIQAILISVRQHKTLTLLIQFSNSIFTNLHKFYFQACWHWTCIQNELIDKVSSILSYLFVLQIQKGQKIFRDFTAWTPSRTPPWTCYGAYTTSGPQPAFYIVWKLNLCSKNGH